MGLTEQIPGVHEILRLELVTLTPPEPPVDLVAHAAPETPDPQQVARDATLAQTGADPPPAD